MMSERWSLASAVVVIGFAVLACKGNHVDQDEPPTSTAPVVATPDPITTETAAVETAAPPVVHKPEKIDPPKNVKDIETLPADDQGSAVGKCPANWIGPIQQVALDHVTLYFSCYRPCTTNADCHGGNTCSLNYQERTGCSKPGS